MPKKNYGFDKRQKELARQRKQEEKRKRKLDRASDRPAADKTEQPDPSAVPPEE